MHVWMYIWIMCVCVCMNTLCICMYVMLCYIGLGSPLVSISSIWEHTTTQVIPRWIFIPSYLRGQGLSRSFTNLMIATVSRSSILASGEMEHGMCIGVPNRSFLIIIYITCRYSVCMYVICPPLQQIRKSYQRRIKSKMQINHVTDTYGIHPSAVMAVYTIKDQ